MIGKIVFRHIDAIVTKITRFCSSFNEITRAQQIRAKSADWL